MLKQGGTEKLWRILAAPPTTSAMIAAPETYSPTRAPVVDYAAVLHGLENDFGQADWQVQNLELGHMLLAATYANMEPKARKQILAKIIRAQVFLATNPASGAMANVTILSLRAPADANVLLEKVEELAAKNFEKINASDGMFRVKEFSTKEFKGIRGDFAKDVQFVMKMRGSDKAVPTRIIRIARGAVMLEMMLANHELSDEQIIRILEKVFDRLSGGAGTTTKPAAKATTRPAA